MAASTTPPAPYTRDFKDTSICVWYRKDRLPDGLQSVALEVKEFGNPAAEWKRVSEAVDAESGSHVVTGLHPNGTFLFRWVYKFADGKEEIGKEVAADTLAAGCVPKDENEKKKGCIVQ
jgi:hypothetical protein